MYWVYLALFIVAVLVPDLVQKDFSFLSETRIEELLIFLLGMAGFLIFILKEHQLSIREEEGARNEKRLFRATKDLAESYGYIGEVNRKMEILMQIGLGLADKSELTKAKEKEIYSAVINSANALMKARCSCLRFIDLKARKTKKEVIISENCRLVKNEELAKMGGKVNIKKTKDYLVVASPKEIKNIRCYLIVEQYSADEVDNANNQEILKFLASQSLSLYAYMEKTEN